MANPFTNIETFLQNLVRGVNSVATAIANSTPGVPSPSTGAAGDYINVNSSASGYQFRTPAQVLTDIGGAALAGSATQTFAVAPAASGSTNAPEAKQLTDASIPIYASAAPGGTPFALRNRIINGDMRVAQEGTSFSTPASGSYTLDQWGISWTGAAPASVAQVAGPTDYEYAAQITGATGNTQTSYWTRIESIDVADLVGAGVALSANLSASVAQTVEWSLDYATASDNFASVTNIATGTWSVTTSAQEFSATVASLPSGAANGLQLTVRPQNGGAFTSGTFNVTGAQLEAGAVATPFERRPFGLELTLCQRYYQTYGQIFAWGYNSTNGTIYCHNLLSPTMRAVPTVTLNSVGTSNASVATVDSVNSSYLRINATITATGAGYSASSATLSAQL